MKGLSIFIIVILAIVGGLLLGLTIGWVIWPVQWVDASPENMRVEWQMDWMNMAIDSYSINQNAEMAAERYAALGEDGPVILAEITANPVRVSSPQVEDFSAAIDQTAPPEGAVVTEAETLTTTQRLLKPPLLGYLLIVLLLALIAVILLVVLVLRLIRQGATPAPAAVSEAEPTAVEQAPDTQATVPQEEATLEQAGVVAAAPTEESDSSGLGTLAGAAAAGAVAGALLTGEREAEEGEAVQESEPEGSLAPPEGEEGRAGEAIETAAVAAGVGWALEEDQGETALGEDETEIVREPIDEEWQPEDTIEAAPSDFYGKYNRKVVEIEGIGEAYAEKLEQAGITTTHGFLQQCATSKGRDELAAKTGISSKLILEWANHADMMRIQGIGPQWSDLLEMAGVNTVLEMAMRNPANLHQKLVEVNDVKGLVRQLPSQAQVEDWIEQAKELPGILTY